MAEKWLLYLYDLLYVRVNYTHSTSRMDITRRVKSLRAFAQHQ